MRGIGRVEHAKDLLEERGRSARRPLVLSLTRARGPSGLGRSCSGKHAAEDTGSLVSTRSDGDHRDSRSRRRLATRAVEADVRLERIASGPNGGADTSLLDMDGPGSDREACGASRTCSVIGAYIGRAAKETAASEARGAGFIGRSRRHAQAKVVDHVDEAANDLVAIIRVRRLACVRVGALTGPLRVVPYGPVNDETARTAVQVLLYIGLLGIGVVVISASATWGVMERGTVFNLSGVVLWRDLSSC